MDILNYGQILCMSTNDYLNSKEHYRENFRFMQMREMDLLDHWNKNFQPDAHQCLAHNRKKEIRSLRFKDLTGAFTVLLIGSLLSLVTFIGEKIMAVYNNRY